MSKPPSYDQHLLDRLNALKNSSIQLDQPKPKLNPSKPATREQDLSARLRSLRTGSLSPSPSPAAAPKPAQSTSKSQPQASNDSLTLFPATPTSQPKAIIEDEIDDDPLRNPHALETDDKTLDELLAELSPDDQWTLNPDDPKDIQKLLDEARGALPLDIDPGSQVPTNKDEKDPLHSKVKDNQNPLTRDLDMSVFTLNNEDEEAHSDQDTGPDRKKTKAERIDAESHEAQEIVSRILDEVNLERQNEPAPQPQPLKPAIPGNENDEPTLSLPSIPSTFPEPSQQTRKSLDFESDISARMAALRGLSSTSPFPSTPKTALERKTDSLGLPSAPTFKPFEKPTPTIDKKFTDEEIDTWCIICQDDATVKCFGCDGELYCATCWKEGHMGPDVGYEERTHRWTKYRPSR